MLKQMSLSNKLNAMIVVPGLALLIYAGMDLSTRIHTSGEMKTLAELTRLAISTHGVAGDLYNERSLTAGSLTESASVSDGVRVQYGQTDQKIAGLQEIISGLDEDVAGPEILGELELILEHLEQLPGIRMEAASGDLSITEMISFYNELTSSLLPIVTETARRSTDATVRTQLLSLDIVGRLKKAADLERGALNVAFSAGEISQGLQQAASETTTRQATLESLFRDYAPSDFVASFEEKLSEELFDEFLMLRLEGLEGVGIEDLGVDPKEWWSLSSERINQISNIEFEIGEVILTTVEDLRSSASRTSMTGIFVVLIVVGGAGLLAVYVGRGVNESLKSASKTVGEMALQISTSVQQLTASTGETAAAMTETSSTVDELRQTSEAAASKAQTSLEAAEVSRGASEKAQSTARIGSEAMHAIREEVESISARIVELSEKNSQIAEILENVDAIAQQSNLLAVNASIEAAKAGEHGRGFAVVANEVKNLAERSKQATDQIRSILSEIQRSSNAAVMVTEQGVKRVDSGSEVIGELGVGIESLAETIEENSESSNQISLISNQQLAGIQQITEALHSVEQATRDNAGGAQQLSLAADELQALSKTITELVLGRDTVTDGR